MAIRGAVERDRGEQRGKGRGAVSGLIAVINALGGSLGWIFARVCRGRDLAGRGKHMQLIESLALGNRRQLLLVVCGGQRYLVGTGADCVGSILALQQGPLATEENGRVTGISAAVLDSERKGPELVRHWVRSTSPEPKPGADRWQ